jgi:glycosyltransferase involved in cell wall biosynthesis
MATISLAMIVKNGAEHLAQTFESAKPICDELIVVDTGSTDDTVAIAESFGAKVHHFDWIDDFSAARNESFGKATGDWIMWLDCGDTISAQSTQSFLQLKSQLDILDNADFIWANINRGITPEGMVVCRFNTPRFVRRTAFAGWAGAVHEYMDKSNENAIIWENASVDDLLPRANTPTDRNINILQKLIAGGDTSTRTAFYYANELRDHKRWIDAIAAYERFLAMEYYSWEYYESLLSMSICYRNVDRAEDAAATYYRAIHFDATRAEAFVGLGDLAYERQKWQQAIPFYKAVIGMTRPSEGFTLETCYSWLPWDRLSICYGNVGLLDEAISAAEETLKTSNERARILDNIMLFYKAKFETAWPCDVVRLLDAL